MPDDPEGPFLRDEWRKTVMKELQDLKDGQRDVVKSVTDLRLQMAETMPSVTVVKDLEVRVRLLENERFKIMGIVIALQVVFAIGLALFEAFRHAPKP